MTDSEIVAFMSEHDDPAFTAAEVGEAVGMTPEGARNRLDELNERGEVYRKKPGRQTVIWWVECDHPTPDCAL